MSRRPDRGGGADARGGRPGAGQRCGPRCGRALARADKALARAGVALVAGYRYLVSPLLPRSCRYVPTCSEYAVEALETHGAARGVLLAARRLARCHPFGGSGLDPVPRRRCEPENPTEIEVN